jgi:hypothetical protein
MSADVAVQGIAQDYVTLLLGIPLLIIALVSARKNNNRGKSLLSGVLLYFLVTYLFYTAMGMYNELFLVYLLLLGSSFFALYLSLQNVNKTSIITSFKSTNTAKNAGLFLMINSIAISVLWLNIIIPPLVDGILYPPDVQHYTTLIVQGFDLGLLLPIGFVIGLLSYRKKETGYFYIITYMVFLSLLMTALISKLGFMAGVGANVIPPIFIIPVICIIAILFSVRLIVKLPIKN